MNVNAQEKVAKQRKYRAWVNQTDKGTLYGLLYEVEDTKLRISTWDKSEPYDLNQFNYMDFYAQDMKAIKLRRKGQTKSGFLIGFVVGFSVGYLTGKRENFFFSEEENQVVSGFLAGGAGAAIGAILASIKIKIPINGSEQQYKANLPRLKKYAYQR